MVKVQGVNWVYSILSVKCRYLVDNVLVSGVGICLDFIYRRNYGHFEGTFG